MRFHSILVALLTPAIALAAACGGDSSSATTTYPTTAEATATTTTASTTTAREGLALATVAEGLDAALLAIGRPGDDRLMVVEQGGRVLALDQAGTERQTFLDLTDLTAAEGERGLLGLAFHPGHAANGLLYVNYTDRDGDTVIAEYTAPANATGADPNSARVLLRVKQPFANHNGGHLEFGPDGMLYIGLGDGGSGGDPENHGQRAETLLGALLRIDVDRRDDGLPYAIPPDNPFVGDLSGRDEIWALGLRNPWRFSFDSRAGGRLWIADVGQSTLEEINAVPAGSAGAGSNFGWNAFEGSEPFVRSDGVDNYRAPVAQYTHADGCSVTGGVVARDAEVPAIDGRYLYGDFCSGRVWTLAADADPGTPVEITDDLGGPLGNITSFGRDNDGAIYVVTPDRAQRLTR